MAFTKRLRRDFSKIERVIELPNLIDVQKRSYDQFLQIDVPVEKRKDLGLQGVFKSVFPISDFNETAALDFVSYDLGQPKYDVDECRQRGLTFAAPIKVTIRLVIWEGGEEGQAKAIQSVKEQEVYFGEIPLMTENATFIINGTERVIVSQLHRSPGVFFDHDKGKSHSSGKILYSARVIPYRGSWIDFEFDAKDILHVRIDRRRKLPATVLLKALGYDEEALLNYFYPTVTVRPTKSGELERSVSADTLVGQRTAQDIEDPKTGEILVKRNRELRPAGIRKIMAAGIKWLPIEMNEIVGGVVARDIVDPKSGELLAECNDELTEEKIERILAAGVPTFDLLHMASRGPSMRLTLQADKIKTADQAIIEIYRRIRPGDPPTPETARSLFKQLFFDADRYDLSKVGRLKLNHKLAVSKPLDQTTLDAEDIMETVRYLLDLKVGKGEIDDIDHLGNRRVRSVGELLENQYRVGLVRMERAIKERMSLQEVDTLMPHDLINSKPVSAVIKEFFGSSQLSQFMDQTNPVSEVTHKRRLSALGPGGLTRERAGFEVRDVHPTHYGRICPIETPEGPNIGLISSLSTYARVNEYGFIETPYKKVVGGRVTDEIHYLSALEEEDQAIAQANAPLDADGRFTNPLVSCRKGGEFMMMTPDEVNYMDVSPNQLVSVVASLIPFLEHDDANRALMGSNMQRQAVPLIRTEAPLVGTGIECTVARDSGVTMVARTDGVVDSVDASRIVIRTSGRSAAERTGTGVDIYNLTKFSRSNQSTCVNQRPIVKRGEKVKAGDIIADGPSTDQGELALGKNVLVAFLPWGGYNFEDSILVSERAVIEDLFTSIHIEDFEAVARDTKLGKEEITRDIPNVGEEALRNLDESGIVRIGAFVRPGDILIGKITPKGETQLSPEEKLLRAIFGEKAGDVRDTSFHVPPGVEGVVIGDRVFQRKGVDKDARTQAIEDKEVGRLAQDRDDQVKITKASAYDKVKKLLVGEKSATKIVGGGAKGVLLDKGEKIGAEALETIPKSKWKDISIQGGERKEAEIQKILQNMQDEVDQISTSFNDKIDRLKKGDELPVGVIKMVKVFVAIKRKLQVGDKMAGRHGNKGVVSMILPREDMPYLPDGTPVDIVLNPLGVPSRMNVGQVLETHLGWAAYALGRIMRDAIAAGESTDQLRARLKDIFRDEKSQKLVDAMPAEEIRDAAGDVAEVGARMATPVFDGATEEEIRDVLANANLPITGQTVLYDGRTGEPFDHQVTVGSMYMLKLHHLVDDKIHARSIGPYSLVTQQPLGGKAQFGGQRLGEMEVWAMEAYGASYALQEFLTVKSDDVAGRTRMYETIVKGDNTLEPGLPESFNVLIKELQSLALDVELLEGEAE